MVGRHLISIGWSNLPAVENRFRQSSATPSHSDSLSAELSGRTGDYEEHKILGETGS
jgi:hypothetical protein